MGFKVHIVESWSTNSGLCVSGDVVFDSETPEQDTVSVGKNQVEVALSPKESGGHEFHAFVPHRLDHNVGITIGSHREDVQFKGPPSSGLCSPRTYDRTSSALHQLCEGWQGT